MTTLSNKDRAIQFSHGEIIHENINDNGICNNFTYSPELPTVTCNSKADAEYIQQKVNVFIRELSRDLLNQ